MATLTFEQKQEITDAIGRVIQLIASKPRGTTIPWSQIEALSFDRYTHHWSAFITRLRRDLLKPPHQLTLFAVTRVGLKVETIQEQIFDRGERRDLRALRQLNRKDKEHAAVPIAQCTDHQRVGLAHQQDRTRVAKQGVRRSLKIGRQLCQPTTSNLPRVKQRG